MDDELLRALARRQARDHVEGDPGMHTASDESYEEPEGSDELSRPLDAAEREAVLDAVFAHIDAQEVAGAAVPVTPAVELAPRRSSRTRLGAMLAATVAIAAALVLWLARPNAGSDEVLPSYAISSLRGGDSAVRSDAADVDRTLVLADDTREIDVAVAPATAISGPVAVTLIAEASGRATRMVAVEGAEISPSGAVRLRGPLSEFIALEPGTWQLWIVITREGERPASPEAAASERRVGFRVELGATQS